MSDSSLADANFIEGMMVKTLGLGLAVAATAGVLHSVWMALSVAAGSGVSGANLAVARWIADRLEASARRDGDAHQTRWAVLLGSKTFILMAVAALAVIVVGLDPFGFIGGYSLFLAALGWQTIAWNISRVD